MRQQNRRLPSFPKYPVRVHVRLACPAPADFSNIFNDRTLFNFIRTQALDTICTTFVDDDPRPPNRYRTNPAHLSTPGHRWSGSMTLGINAVPTVFLRSLHPSRRLSRPLSKQTKTFRTAAQAGIETWYGSNSCVAGKLMPVQFEALL